MTKASGGVGLRIVLICLAFGLVVAGTFLLTPRFDLKKQEAAQIAQMQNHAPMPGSEAALRQSIAEVQSGMPDYDRARRSRAELRASLTWLQRGIAAAEGGIPDPPDRQLLAAARQQQQVLAKLGPLQSTQYLGGNGRFDRYRVTFQKGTLLWSLVLGKNGALLNYGFNSEGIPTPQDYIDNYARFPVRQRSGRLAMQFGILLAAAIFGRLALRLRV